jgi:predicted XRE-type DNA-binding protein
MKMESFASVWDALESDPVEIASLKARSELMIAIIRTINDWNVQRAAAAKRMGITSKRLKDLYKGNMDEFSLDDLVRLASQAGLSVKLDVTRSAA